MHIKFYKHQTNLDQKNRQNIYTYVLSYLVILYKLLETWEYSILVVFTIFNTLNVFS